jgi:hypothetical protein
MTNLNENENYMVIFENSLKHLKAGGHFMFRETSLQEISMSSFKLKLDIRE